ncbi:MAG: hypothetical protein AB1626_02260 [Candidatus Micrarchaeota archaeon]
MESIEKDYERAGNLSETVVYQKQLGELVPIQAIITSGESQGRFGRKIWRGRREFGMPRFSSFRQDGVARAAARKLFLKNHPAERSPA